MIKIFISDNQDAINGQMNINKQTDVLNLINFKDLLHSQSYNPLSFVYEDSEIYDIAAFLYKELNLKNPASFFLITSIFGFLINYRPENEQNLTSLYKIIKAKYVKNNNEEFTLDKIISEIHRRYLKFLDKGFASSFVIKNYEMFSAFSNIEKENAFDECEKAFFIFGLAKNINFFYACDIELLYENMDNKTTYICMPSTDSVFFPYSKLLIKNLFNALSKIPILDTIIPDTLIELDENIDENIKKYIKEQNTCFVLKEIKPVTSWSINIINSFNTKNYLQEYNFIFEDEILDKINMNKNSNNFLSKVKDLKNDIEIDFEPMLDETKKE